MRSVGVLPDNLTTGRAGTTFVPVLSLEEAQRRLAPECVSRHHIVEMDELGSADIERWLNLRASNPALDSPYFHPAFT